MGLGEEGDSSGAVTLLWCWSDSGGEAAGKKI